MADGVIKFTNTAAERILFVQGHFDEDLMVTLNSEDNQNDSHHITLIDFLTLRNDSLR